MQAFKSDYDFNMKLTGFVTFLPFLIQIKFYLTNLAEDVENEKMLILMNLSDQLSYLSCTKNHRNQVSLKLF